MQQPLPVSLQHQIDTALGEMRGSAGHSLSPERRRAIYESIGPAGDPRAQQVRGWLAVTTARYVLPLWETWAAGAQDEPQSEAPATLVELASAVLTGTADREFAAAQASDYWNVAGNVVDGAVEYGDTPLDAAYAFAACALALHEALGADLLARLPEASGLRDEDQEYPEHARDTASAAVVAEAGAPWLGQSDPVRRQAFWEWWLNEAFRASWATAHPL